ncbi:MAG TPA: glycosyltransferase, partial [Candidatus Paceibacterota bacterium]
MTRVLMLSTDANIFDETSDVRERMKWYGTVFEELHIIVCTTKLKVKSEKLKVSENVFAYSALSALRFLCLWEAYRIAKNIIQTINYQLSTTNCVVITTQDPFEVGLVGYALKRRFGVPLQLQVHTDFLSPYFWRESLKNKIRVLLAHFLIPRADGIRAVSTRIKNQLQTTNYKLKTDPVILPVFVDVRAIKDAEAKVDLHSVYSSYDFIILMASRLTREKNIAMALEAMRQIILKFPKTLLLIVGSGPAKKMLSLRVERNCLEQNVIFSAWTNNITSY